MEVENRITILEGKVSNMEVDIARLQSTVESTCKLLEKIDSKVDLIISRIADFQTELKFIDLILMI